MYSAKLRSCMFLFVCMWQTLSCSEKISYETTDMIRQDILNGAISIADGIDQIINHHEGDAKKMIQQLEKEQKYLIKDFERMSQDLDAAAKKRMERVCADGITRLYEEIDKQKRIITDAATTRERIVQGLIGGGLMLLGYALFTPKNVPQPKKDVPGAPKTEPIKPVFFSKPEQKKPSMQASQEKWDAKTFLSSMAGLLYSQFLLVLAGDFFSSPAPAALFTRSGFPVLHPGIGLLGAAAYVQAAIIEKYIETMNESDVQRVMKRTDPLFLR